MQALLIALVIVLSALGVLLVAAPLGGVALIAWAGTLLIGGRVASRLAFD